jgi:hypothetical protein
MRDTRYITAALRRIPYQKVAHAINRKHLNCALSRIPPIILKSPLPFEEPGIAGMFVGGAYVRGRRVGTDAGTIYLDPKRMAKDLQFRPVTTVLAHELIHAIQYQRRYVMGHGKAFDAASQAACHSGLRVADGKGNVLANEGDFPAPKNLSGLLKKITRARR